MPLEGFGPDKVTVQDRAVKVARIHAELATLDKGLQQGSVEKVKKRPSRIAPLLHSFQVHSTKDSDGPRAEQTKSQPNTHDGTFGSRGRDARSDQDQKSSSEGIAGQQSIGPPP